MRYILVSNDMTEVDLRQAVEAAADENTLVIVRSVEKLAEMLTWSGWATGYTHDDHSNDLVAFDSCLMFDGCRRVSVRFVH